MYFLATVMNPVTHCQSFISQRTLLPVNDVRIVLFCGGTGSVALQSGLYRSLESHLDGIDTKIIVNAYDNGLSTGIVRRVMDGEILGPSDVRKNQLTRLRLLEPESPWLKFLNLRFDSPTAEVKRFCTNRLESFLKRLEINSLSPHRDAMLADAIEEYFRSPTALQVEYKDFSLGNILYAGLARSKRNSLRAAASLMAEAIGVPDHVILNDDRSLFLGAITQSGEIVSDEARIVAWGNQQDPFVDIFFADAEGRPAQPQLCLEAWNAIVHADLILLSAGTQWSSLIPTYASDGFIEAISESQAKVIMVMNRIPDHDSPSQTASDIINTLVPRFFPDDRLNVLVDRNGHPQMNHLDQGARAKVATLIIADLSERSDSPDKHDSKKLAHQVGCAYFREHLDSGFFLFDYDDTLVGRNGTFSKASSFNTHALGHLGSVANVGICTGNAALAVKLNRTDSCTCGWPPSTSKPIPVFADGAINEYAYTLRSNSGAGRVEQDFKRCVSPEALLPTEGSHGISAIINSLLRAGLPASSIENRGGALIAIKPAVDENRRALICLIRHLISGSDLLVRETGTTTVEICKPALSKAHALKALFSEMRPTLTVTYVGDELASGNDRDISLLEASNSRLKCLPVEGPAETAFFLQTLIEYLDENAAL